jgi:hypothetical protein
VRAAGQGDRLRPDRELINKQLGPGGAADGETIQAVAGDVQCAAHLGTERCPHVRGGPVQGGQWQIKLPRGQNLEIAAGIDECGKTLRRAQVTGRNDGLEHHL